MELTGVQKAAAFLLSLDTQTAASILCQFHEEEIGVITREMLDMRSLDREMIQQVHEEFISAVKGGGDFILDTRPVAEQLITSAVGEERGRKMLNQSHVSMPRRRPFEALQGADENLLADVLKSEHAQTIAQVLAHLEPHLAGQVLTRLPEEVHSNVVLRMTRLESASAQLLDRLDRIILGRIKADPKAGVVNAESKDELVAEMLNVVGKTVRKKALDELAREDPERAKEIESLMFVFEDFMLVNTTAIRKIIMEVDNDTLALSLKNASKDLKEKFLSNLSKRAGAMVQETLDELGPKPLSEVEAAQHEIMGVARSLDEQGEIALRQGEEEQMV
ncbi:MAG: flagellar motor switch protein FliG [Planctomycetes bacterium]|nr:flagellar motor switch protein FliG [Planctomycetota bacterium]